MVPLELSYSDIYKNYATYTDKACSLFDKYEGLQCNISCPMNRICKALNFYKKPDLNQ